MTGEYREWLERGATVPGVDGAPDEVRRMEALLGRHPRVSWLTPRESRELGWTGAALGRHACVWTLAGEVHVQAHGDLRVLADAMEACERAGALPGGAASSLCRNGVDTTAPLRHY